MNETQWLLIEDGATVGTVGTEGEIVQDHHIPGEARTTLERRNEGYAITTGIYGWMVCTIFLGEDEIEQLYPEVQRELQRIVELIPFEEEETTEAMERVTGEIRKFVARY